MRPAGPGNRPGGLIAHSPEGRAYLLGEREAGLFLLMDGTRGIDELAVTAGPCQPIADPREIRRYVGRLQEAGLLQGSSRRPLAFPSIRAAARIELGSPSRLLEPAGRLLAKIPAPAAAAVFCLSLSVGAWAVMTSLGAISTLYAGEASTSRLGATATLALLLGVAHELAHGAAAARFGVPVRCLGLSAVGWRPAFFVEIPGLMTLPRRERMWVIAAGPLADAWFAAAAASTWRLLPQSGEPAALVACALLARVAWNALPALRTDGARMLEAGLRIPNLEARARAETVRRLRAILGGAGGHTGLPDGGLFWYGLLSLTAETALVLGLALLVLRGLS